LLKAIRREITIGNVAAIIAAILIGVGAAHAGDLLSGASLKNRSVAAKKIKRNALTGKEIRESRLKAVPRAAFARRAANASALNGQTADALRVACPGDTRLAAGVCLDRVPRRTGTYLAAVNDCNFNKARHLPTHDQLLAYVSDPEVELAPGGEFVAPVVALPNGTPGIGVMTDEAGTLTFVPAFGTEQRAFRCVAQLSN
jgi:hypothetical protein